MIQRRKPLARKTPLKRGGYIARISNDRRSERAMYNADRAEYLRDHPYCEIYIARYGLDPKAVFANNGVAAGFRVPRSNQIHHRNKTNGPRLLDKRFWMAASAKYHRWAEEHKDDARAIGILLPIQADIHGRWGNAQQGLTTPELLLHRIGSEALF